MDVVSYLLSKRYVDDTIKGSGALKGAACEISSIEPIKGGNKITFSWEYSDGSKDSAFIIVKDGAEGANGVTPEIGANGNWFIAGVDTGVVAAPDLAGYYNEDNFIPLTDEEIDQLCSDEEV
jgi:hypothetical protein